MKKPNIVVITTDQQRFDTVGIYGKTPYGIKVKTDHLDQFAREGVRFTNAFTCCPLCSPARTSFLTGTYPHIHYCMTNTNMHPMSHQIKPEDDQVLKGLKAQGYNSAYVGKWHVHNDLNPADFGYDYHVGLGDYDDYRKSLGYPIVPQSKHYATAMGGLGDDPIPTELSRPVFLTNAAMGYIEQFAKEDKPFFVRLDFHGPHFPSVIPEPYCSMYKPEDIQPIPSFFDDMSTKPAIQTQTAIYWSVDNLPWSDWQKLISKYMGEVTMIDDMVGRVMDKVKELGLDEDTIFFFSTDHGDNLGAHKIFDKSMCCYDDNCHVPLLARWKGHFPENTVCDKFVSHYVDICPTILEAIGADIPEEIQGLSFLPLCRGEEQPERKPYVGIEFHGSHMGLYSIRGIRDDHYHYNYQVGGIDELYDVQADPYESHNLIDDPAYADILKEYRYKLCEWMKDAKDPMFTEYVIYHLTRDAEYSLQGPGRGRSRW